MIAGNAELYLGLFIGYALGLLTMCGIVIGSVFNNAQDYDNQYDPERLP